MGLHFSAFKVSFAAQVLSTCAQQYMEMDRETFLVVCLRESLNFHPVSVIRTILLSITLKDSASREKPRRNLQTLS